LGTVKFGRNQKIKYPSFLLPTDREIEVLLDVALELGINLLDTAPAYGIAEERLGKLLGSRPFLLSTKTGEEFANGESTYDFSAEHTRKSVERSLKRLRRSVLDCVLVHCTQGDLETLRNTPVLPTLASLKEKGDIRAFGASTTSVEGGMAAAEACDVVMVTFNPAERQEAGIIERAAALNKGIFIKKAFGSGSLVSGGVEECVRASLTMPGVSSLIVGTVSPDHLRANALAIGKIGIKR
jgi:aryl-alcohol dehydrogenase-like predicted oxidoreductase